MKDHAVTGLALIVLFVGGGAGLLVVPSLQDAQLTVDTEASRGVEKARRLLSGYSANVARLAHISDELKGLGVDIVRSPADQGEDRDEFDALFEEELDAQTSEFSTKADHRPSGGLAGQIEDGLDARRRCIQANDKLLADALGAVTAALSIQRGSADASSNAEGNRLAGLILFFQGEAAASRAAQMRSRSVAVRERLATLGLRVAALEPITRLVADSKIDERSAKLAAELKRRVSVANDVRDQLAEVAAKVSSIEADLATAQALAATARESMEKLQADGIDFGDPRGFELFEASYQQVAGQYRGALSKVHALEHGTLPNATIEAGGDFLWGRYTENGSTDHLTLQPGLTHYRAEQERLRAAVLAGDQSVTALGDDIGRLGQERQTLQQRQSQGFADIDAAKQAASVAYQQLLRIGDEVLAVEAKAIESYRQCGQAFERAEQAIVGWVNDADQRLQGLTPQTRSLSAFQTREDDRWIGSHVATERAAAEAGLAWLYYQQFAGASREADLLTAYGSSLGLADLDVEQVQAAAEKAQEEGIAIAEQAIKRLEQAHRDLGRNWTVTAQHAGTTYLLVLFGQEGHLRDVTENYRNALSGQEDASYVQPLRDRLAALERR